MAQFIQTPYYENEHLLLFIDDLKKKNLSVFFKEKCEVFNMWTN